MVGAVLATLVLVLGVWGSQGHGTIKLCGKDLVRTVLLSCGNPRGRRSVLEFGPHHSPIDSQGSILDWLGDEQLASLSARGEEQASTEGQPEEAKAAPSLPSMPPQLRGEVASSVSSARTRRNVMAEEICCQFGCNLNELSRKYC